MPMDKYHRLLTEKYPTKQAICREIINQNAILNLPKGTEHFMSDLHGEYEAFKHILNNCSGVISEKVGLLFSNILSEREQQELCTLIYYPKEKLSLLQQRGRITDDWYRVTLYQLLEVAKLLSSKYTRQKVRQAMPEEYAYIIDELIHVQKDEDDNQERYHRKIMDTILMVRCGDDFLISLAELIKRLAVDHLHIIGDIFDRGPFADKIIDLLIQYHTVDIQWGNHDILWMGAACGNETCIAMVIRNSLRYDTLEILENEYGISLRSLISFAKETYRAQDEIEAAYLAMSVILFKLEGRLVRKHPEYGMQDRALLEYVHPQTGEFVYGDKVFKMNQREFPTLDTDNPYQLTDKEAAVVDSLYLQFRDSRRLEEHIMFLYEKGSMYKIHNGNLLYHGCVPLDEQGFFQTYEADGHHRYVGRSFLDYADRMARSAWDGDQEAIDFMWFLWGSIKSPLSGRHIRTFERTYLLDEATWKEERNAYYSFYEEEKVCLMILHEFGIYSEHGHIINGHTPVRTKQGELPIRANGKLFVIDGGFCSRYHETTGIAGYTLIYNSHGLRIKSHQPFESVEKAILENQDVESHSQIIERSKSRILVRHSDKGHMISEYIEDLMDLLKTR